MNENELNGLNNLADQVSTAPAVQLGVMILLGVLYCFVGYRLFKVMLSVTGFTVLGGLAGMVANVGFPESPVVYIGVGILCGIVGAMTLLFLYKVGVFVLGAAFGGLVTYQVLLGTQPDWMPWAILGIGLVTGVVALWLEKPMLSLAMASIGAWLMLAAVAVLLFGGGDFRLEPESITSFGAWGLLLCWVTLTIAGMATQLGSGKPREQHHHHHHYVKQ